MPDIAEYSFFLRDAFPGASPELLRLFDAAAENATLLRSDFYTIRDWVEIAGYGDEAWLPALLLVLLLSLEEGSFCVELTQAGFVGRLADLVGVEEAQAWATRLLEGLAIQPCDRLIGAGPAPDRPVIRYTVDGRDYLYFQKFLQAELRFEQQFTSRLEPMVAEPGLEEVVHEVVIAQPLRRLDGLALELDGDQRQAVATALSRTLAIVSGGPGTGKTSIVLNLLRCLVRRGCAPDRIALAAPTGRAAQRLGEALRQGLAALPSARDPASPDAQLGGVTASTLHQLLGYRPTTGTFARHDENPVPADVVVVDEVSMVGVVMMSQLFQALAPGTRVILLGDRDQLPSVEAGAVLASLVGDEPTAAASPVVRLRTNHRSQPAIRAAALAVNRREADIVETLPPLHMPAEAERTIWWNDLELRGGCYLLEQTLATGGEVRGFVRHWIDQLFFGGRPGESALADLVRACEGDPRSLDAPERGAGLRQIFRLLERGRLLTLVREGPWGCVELNRFCDQLLRPRLDADLRPGLFAGAPVLIVRNDPTHGLFNGDVGIALPQGDGLRVVFARPDGFLALPAEALPAHELGFALTVHKSQGSEYEQVMVIVPPEGGRRLLTKELIYTAITRAKSLAILCGTKDVLRFAIGRQIRRESAILSRLARNRLSGG